MLGSTLLWVVGLLLLIVVILHNTPRAKAARARGAEEKRRRQEERSREMREVTEKQTRQLENLRKQRLVVYIREKDGRKCGFEAILINRLLEEGVTVQPLLENTGRALANGDTSSLNNGLLALVGTWWEVDMTHHDSEREFAHKMNAQHCDYRLLGMDEQRKGKILGAGSKRSRRWETALSAQIIEGLVATFPVDNE